MKTQPNQDATWLRRMADVEDNAELLSAAKELDAKLAALAAIVTDWRPGNG